MNELWKSLYGYLPVFAQNAAISAYGYHYRRERFGPTFEPTVAEFVERETWPSERMSGYVDARLRQVLRCAYEAPWYRAEWSRLGITAHDLSHMGVADLWRLPVLTKDALRRDPLALAPNRGRGVRNLLTYQSSGSTGTPIRVICTSLGQQRFAAAREARSYRWAGTSIRRPRAMIGGQPIVPRGDARPPFYRYNAAERQVYFSAYHLAPGNVADYVRGFNRFRPELVTGYAFSQFLLAKFMLQQGVTFDFPPAVAITSSERLTSAMKAVIAQSWGCRAFQEYGSVENCALLTECEAGSLHAHPDFGVIEIVDDHGRPVPAGVEGRLLCTGLLNEVQFLVRYEIGDIAAWGVDKCSCGRDALPNIAALTGRVEDVVVGPDGRQMVRFHGIFVGLPFVIQGQVVQEAVDRFTVRVVTETGFGESQAAEIRRRFNSRLGDVKVAVEPVGELERTPAGKIRAVISRLRVPQAAAETGDMRGASGLT